MLLSDICEIIMGQSPSSDSYNVKGQGLPFFQGNADFGKLYPSVRLWCNCPIKKAEAGDLLVSVRAPIGAVNLANQKCCIGRGLAALRPYRDKCDAMYLYYLIKAGKNKLNWLGTGSTFKAITRSSLLSFNVPDYCIAFQRKISGKLWSVDKLIHQRNEQLKLFDLLIQSRFLEMFGDIELNSQNMQKMMWQEVFDTQTGKLDANAAVKGGRYPFFTCAKEISTIDEYAYDCEALLLAGNNAVGDYDVKYYKGKFNAYQRTYILMLKNRQYSYSVFKFQLEQKLRYLQLQSKGTNTRYLTMGILKSLDFIVPPIVKQQEFAQFVNATDKSKMAVQKSLDELEILKKSLMQTYFG
ncbi:restriction endonuclease subunit S [Dialister succinatiphilus]|uniref:restriction endonuclease subunit S n=1 Tax=Dialister succinatiphilus TaxID=487173 RepID=UPI003F7EF5DC